MVSALLPLLLAPFCQGTAPGPAPDPAADPVHWVEFESRLLSSFWGRPIRMRAGVVLPPDRLPGEEIPACYSIHGFGGSHLEAARRAPGLLRAMAEQGYPRMAYVFLDASCPFGHHAFADSVNNGPWGTALVEEFIPELERRFDLPAEPTARLLTGHSSGGWSSLWLQIRHPEFFGGVWATAPDPVDFRDFTGVDIYTWRNAYVDPAGKEVQLVRGPDGSWRMSLREFCARELARQGEYGGQMASFDAVFSPRGEDGRPMPLFDRATGAIDPMVARAWQRYDISLILRRDWARLGPLLRGRLHVWIGDRDTFRLEGAVRLLQAELERLGSDADILIVPGRDHGSLFQPHQELWPDGLLARIHHEMWRQWAGR
ncbi:MAG: hypothetical protein D6702_08565 [Planctomycetota bacterium]|nr:MAG: hypothetical protein D6702_08565 [Planctomycetota bacterium]